MDYFAIYGSSSTSTLLLNCMICAEIFIFDVFSTTNFVIIFSFFYKKAAALSFLSIFGAWNAGKIAIFAREKIIIWPTIEKRKPESRYTTTGTQQGAMTYTIFDIEIWASSFRGQLQNILTSETALAIGTGLKW